MKKLVAGIAALTVAVGGYFLNIGNVRENNNIKPPQQIVSIQEVPSDILDVSKEGITPFSYINTSITKVTDGDTVEIAYKGKDYKVRLLDVDTPESVKKDVAVQVYGKEASELTKKMLLNQPVKLVFEKGIHDRYGRLLAYIILKDNSLYNAMLVRNGYARVEIVSPNSKFSEYFYSIQDQAIKNKAGFWALPDEKQPFVKNAKGQYIPRYQMKKGA